MKKSIILYLLLVFLLSVYSFSQIDLNLTISSNPLYQNFQRAMIYLGYFNRPFSTAIFIVLSTGLFLVYLLLLKLIREKKLSFKMVRKGIIIIGLVTLLAYPSFSHDLFNYMFDARIVTKYGLNPYQYKALDFSSDLWTRFMHWTHRTYPYGPTWLLLTIPFSFLGFQKFTLTFLLFKILFLFSYWFSGFFIYKILKEIKNKNPLLGLVYFAFNPLIIIEGLISPHNDSLTLVFLLISLLLFTQGKRLASVLTMLVSGGIKYITLPLTLINLFFKKNRHATVINLYLIVYSLSLIPAVLSRELLPWYAFGIIGLFSLMPENIFIRRLGIILSFVLLGKYLPFLYSGEWSVSAYNFYLALVVGTSLLYCLTMWFGRKISLKSAKIK